MTAKRRMKCHLKVDVCTTIMLKGLLFAEKFQLADRTCSRLCATGFSAQFDRVDHLGASEMCASNKVGFTVKIASNFKVWNFSRVQVLINLSDGLVSLPENQRDVLNYTVFLHRVCSGGPSVDHRGQFRHRGADGLPLRKVRSSDRHHCQTSRCFEKGQFFRPKLVFK